jgi:hypothetical protein
MMLLASMLLGCLGISDPAIEVTGKVIQVSGDTVTIVPDSGGAQAQPGDSVVIFFMIPGIDQLGKVGAGLVVIADAGHIVARIDQHTGSLTVGQIAKIQATGARTAGRVARRVTEESKESNRAVGGRWVFDWQWDTALDTRTKLMWIRRDFQSLFGRTAKSWYEAVDWARQINRQNYAGYHDWRLPSVAEYRTLEDKTFYTTVFGSLPEYPYWTRNEIGKHLASFIGLFEGWATSSAKSEGDHPPRSARLVRRSE